MTNSRLTDPDVLKFRFSVRLESFEVRANTGAQANGKAATAACGEYAFQSP